MSHEPLTNTVMERFTTAYGSMNEFSELPSEWAPGLFAVDFVLDDRQTGGVNLGQLDKSSYLRVLEQFWRVGGQPHFSVVEVIAVRGERCAAWVAKVGFADDAKELEHVLVVRIDVDLQRAQRIVQFDLDDRDAAVTELDRLHTEIDD